MRKYSRQNTGCCLYPHSNIVSLAKESHVTKPSIHERGSPKAWEEEEKEVASFFKISLQRTLIGFLFFVFQNMTVFPTMFGGNTVNATTGPVSTTSPNSATNSPVQPTLPSDVPPEQLYHDVADHAQK